MFVLKFYKYIQLQQGKFNWKKVLNSSVVAIFWLFSSTTWEHQSSLSGLIVEWGTQILAIYSFKTLLVNQNNYEDLVLNSYSLLQWRH